LQLPESVSTQFCESRPLTATGNMLRAGSRYRFVFAFICYDKEPGVAMPESNFWFRLDDPPLPTGSQSALPS